jgi:hypothetical protein
MLMVPGQVWFHGVPDEFIPYDYHPVDNPYNIVIDMYYVQRSIEGVREDE